MSGAGEGKIIDLEKYRSDATAPLDLNRNPVAEFEDELNALLERINRSLRKPGGTNFIDTKE